MSYSKPEIKKITVDIKVMKKADEQTSCAGGHCVRARYSEDF